MAHLKLYLNGTPGGTNGEELTESTVLKGIMTNTHASYKDYGGAILPVCLRCDTGFKASNVVFKYINNVFSLPGYYQNKGYYTIDNLETFKNICGNGTFIFNGLSTITPFAVGNINVMVILCIEAASTDTTALTDLFSVSYVEDATA